MDNKDETNGTTHFGYQKVRVEDKAGRVANVFHSVADQYDVMNDLMSMGVHRLWKRFTVELSGVRRGQRVLDIAGGTGDLTAKFASLVGEEGQVILSDINASMLENGRARMIDSGHLKNIDYVLADAQYLPFPDNHFDCISIAFGLRNVTDKALALRSMYRVLKPGGRLLVLEFSQPKLPSLKSIYDLYSFKVLPLMGKLVANDPDSYRYLAESIRMHPDQQHLKDMILEAGFDECDYHNLSGGIVALHRAYKY